MRPRLVSLAAASALLLPVLGCGDDDSEERAEFGKWALLGAVVDLSRDTPTRAVERYTGRLEAGASVFALVQYAPEVRRRVGPRRMLAALEQVAVSYARGRTRVIGVSHGDPLVTVRAAVIPPVGERRAYRFELIRHGARWLITYDGLTQAALITAAKSEAIIGGRPESADAEARELVRSYRAAGREAQRAAGAS
jgi:hypothetical protein